jgi:hypothetical protein
LDNLRRFAGAGLLILAGLGAAEAHGQATPTATAAVQFSGFGGVSGVYTGLGLGRNLSVTAGADMTLRSFYGLYPGVEVRGTYPVDDGSVDSQRNILGGLVVSRHLGNLQPYGDILFGRGQINYSPPYLNPAGTIYYVQSTSDVISPGAGVNYFVSNRLGFKGDFQFQRYLSPATPSGSVYSKSFTLGVVYRLNLGGLGRLRHY